MKGSKKIECKHEWKIESGFSRKELLGRYSSKPIINESYVYYCSKCGAYKMTHTNTEVMRDEQD